MKIEIVKITRSNAKIIHPNYSAYDETVMPVPTSRVLDGSDDHGYYCEYIGRGTYYGLPVSAVYILDDCDVEPREWEDYRAEEDYDWDAGLSQGRLVVGLDDLEDIVTPEQMDALQSGATITIESRDL